MLEAFMRFYEEKRRFVVFDVETVGAFHHPQIVEIGAVEAGQDFVKDYRSFQKVLRFRPPSWHPYQKELSIHKIPTQEIENGEDPTTALKSFLDFIEGSVLICHTSFDVRAMKRNLKMNETLVPFMDLPIWEEYIDSCKLAKKMCPTAGSYSLSNLASYFHVENPQAHRALADALTTKRIIGKLLKAQQDKEIEKEKICQLLPIC